MPVRPFSGARAPSSAACGAPGSSPLELAARRAPDLHVGAVRGRTFVHNPFGQDALAILDDDEARMFFAADGRPVVEIARELSGGDAATEQRLLAAVSSLAQHGFVTVPGAPSHVSPAERFLNVWVHMTNACNLACPHCYIAKSPQSLGPAVAADLLSAIERTAASGEVDRIHLRFAGGEPMLRFRDLRTLHAEANRACEAHGVRLTAAVITNGTVVPTGAPEWMREHDVWLSVSLDGLGAEQEKMRPLRGGGSSWQRVTAGLERYRAVGLAPYVLVTLGPDNLDGIPDLVDHLLEEGLHFRLSLVRDLEAGTAPLAVSDAMLARVREVLADTYARIERALESRGGPPLSPPFRKMHRFCDLELWRPVRKACGAGETYLSVGQDGAVSACHASLRAAHDRLDGGASLLDQATGQTQLRSFERERGNEECNRCAFRASCAGGCPLLLHRRDGHVDGRSPYCAIYRDVIPRILHAAALELLLAGPAQLAVSAQT